MANDWIDVPAPAAAPKPAASAGGDWVDAPPAAAPKTQFPQDAPNTYYGNILPFSKDMGTGKVSLDAPEIVRSPARGAVDIYHRLTQPYQPADLKTLNPDELGLVASMGGVRAGPESVVKTSGPTSAAKAAHDAGYVLPPVEATAGDQGIVSSLLSGWSGKIKTQQAASEANQAVTTKLATKALGLPEGTPLTDKVFEQLRADAGQKYKAVTQSIPTVYVDLNPQISAWYDQAVGQLGGANSQAAKYFPDITKNQDILNLSNELARVRDFPTEAGVEVVKELRHNATANLKSIGDPSKHALGLAQRQGADLVDELMERNIEAAGKPDVIAAYKDARRLIAKSYDVQSATNSATGDVNAAGLAKLAAKGRPLTDELKAIADAAAAFPKDVQNPAKFGGNEPFSALDFFGATGSAVAGHPGAAGAILGRPVARAAILSGPYQRGLMTPKYGSAPGVAARQLFNPGLSPNPYDALGIQPP